MPSVTGLNFVMCSSSWDLIFVGPFQVNRPVLSYPIPSYPISPYPTQSAPYLWAQPSSS